MPKSRSFSFKRPQQFAAILLLILLAECLWVGHRQTLTTRDYEFARCGREMWEKPSPLAGYFTSCGNIPDGTLGYRAAGLPLTIERILAGQASGTSTWEMRHEVKYVLLLLHSAFILTGLLLGAALWWVTRRLYGNSGGFIALALYCFSPSIVRASTNPNNDILTAFGLFAAIYTSIGIAHAMQGPRQKWRPRIVLLTLALGFTAAAHVAAFLVAIVLAFILMEYVAKGYRASVIPVLATAIVGALVIVFASYAFEADPFSYYFSSGAGRMWLSLDASWFLSLPNAAAAIAAMGALALYIAVRRSRYFGNTLPLLVSALLFFLITTSTESNPAIWALPFIFAFIAGVFADTLETRARRVFVWITGSLLVLQAVLCLLSLPSLSS